MATINENFLNLKDDYLFAVVSQKTADYAKAHPDQKIIRLSIGDVTLPLAEGVIEALHSAVNDMSRPETFHGYGPYEGYEFLRRAVQGYYTERGVSLEPDEIFISDGAKSDAGNITDIFGPDNTVLIPDPVYPVYVDVNIMSDRKIVYLDATEENGFLPLPPAADYSGLIYLCSPNNPTGATYNKEQLTQWVNYAQKTDSVILFDAAYEAYVTDSSLPRSIFEIPGAKDCAIEFCSFSKTAGFTGTRLGYTIVPKALTMTASSGAKVSLHDLWYRRQSTKYNGVPYIIQRGGAAVFTSEGRKQTQALLEYYRVNARSMTELLTRKGIPFWGGINSPYLWMKCPDGMGSWRFFDYLLEQVQVVGTPGAGFGQNGEGYFRLTSFGNREQTAEAIERLDQLL